MSVSLPFNVGDIVRVFTKDPQDNKVHPTAFEGIVIAMRGTAGNKTFTVRKISYDHVAVERIFPVDSPSIEQIKLVKSGGHVRRAKLYYLRKKR